VIGVVAKENQRQVVEEFFELFKTPWEPFCAEHEYDVVVVTADQVPAVNARLILIYSADEREFDGTAACTETTSHACGVLEYEGAVVPVYGKLRTFPHSLRTVSRLESRSGTAAVAREAGESRTIRVGFDLFEEVRTLLTLGQPVEQAAVPTLDLHIAMLRHWMIEADIAFAEILPSPANADYIVCLTHDIDFVGIRRHLLDHSMWGFIYRATVGSVVDMLRGRKSAPQMFRNWWSVMSLPFVYLGIAKDFWEPFEWYLRVEEGLPSTYFIIPFKERAGEKVPGSRASRRATGYDVADIAASVRTLLDRGCEVGVHGIDSWNSAESGRKEQARVAAVTGHSGLGIRMHWLLFESGSAAALEEAGYSYDSTTGYNETVGYRAGTMQAFRPLGQQTILELPMHIQDGALFYPGRLHLTEVEADARCIKMMDEASRLGGVITILWHDRSHGPERFWGGFYSKLVQALKQQKTWFASGSQATDWFRKRRNVRFSSAFEVCSQAHVRRDELLATPPLKVRIYNPHHPSGCALSGPALPFAEFAWDGNSAEEFQRGIASVHSSTRSESVLPLL
jgi:hypothetical protein